MKTAVQSRRKTPTTPQTRKASTATRRARVDALLSESTSLAERMALAKREVGRVVRPGFDQVAFDDAVERMAAATWDTYKADRDILKGVMDVDTSDAIGNVRAAEQDAAFALGVAAGLRLAEAR